MEQNRPIITFLGDPDEDTGYRGLKPIIENENSLIPYNALVDLSQGSYIFASEPVLTRTFELSDSLDYIENNKIQIAIEEE